VADQASSNITINAPRDRVLQVIADLERYPEWTKQIKTAEVLEADAAGRPRRGRFVLDAGPIRDTYELQYEWSEQGCSWEMVGSSQVQKSQVGSYTLADRGAETEVTYRLTVDTAIPMLGMLKRKAEKTIIDSALKDLKKHVEKQG
jgi:uncharacterized membrane protein